MKRLGKLSEESKISIRNLRKKFRQSLTKDEINEVDKSLQSVTDEKILEIELLVEHKIGSLS